MIDNITYHFCFLLFLVLFLGNKAGGAQRWLSFGAIRFQPSEFAKISSILMVSKFFYNNRDKHEYTLIELWPVIINSLIVFILIFKQPI